MEPAPNFHALRFGKNWCRRLHPSPINNDADPGGFAASRFDSAPAVIACDAGPFNQARRMRI
jgi:hypothetical protein